jgi:hypothetical protein
MNGNFIAGLSHDDVAVKLGLALAVGLLITSGDVYLGGAYRAGPLLYGDLSRHPDDFAAFI